MIFTAEICAAQTLSPIGVARSHLSTLDKGAQQETVSDIHSVGATWFRDGPTSGSPRAVSNFVEEVRLAKQQKLKVLVNILQLDDDYDGPLVRNSHGWNAKALSKVNLDKFSQRLRTLLTALKAADLTIDAVEFGNEDDTSAYDADVPDGHPASPEELHTWLRGYGEFLKTGATLLRSSDFYPEAKIITFGIAHGGDRNEALADPAKAVAMLRNVDGANYLENAVYRVDGYATHLYPSPNNTASSVTALLHQDISALGHNKPLWITEFGFLHPRAFPNKQGESFAQGLTDLIRSLDDFAHHALIGPMIFYSYNSGLSDAKGNLTGFKDAQGNFVPAVSVLRARAMQQ